MSNKTIIKGKAITSGIETGKAFLFHSHRDHIFKENIRKDKIEAEKYRFLNAVKKSKSQLKKISADLEKKLGKESALIIDFQHSLLNDKSLLDAIIKVIESESVRSEWAINTVEKEYIKIFSNIPDLSFKERGNDISDILNRVINNLKKNKINISSNNKNIILVADDIPPSIAATLISKKKILGLILDNGGETSHSVILAKALEIPTIIGTANGTVLIENDDNLIIDGIEGKIIVNPKEQICQRYKNKKKEYLKYIRARKKVLKLPNTTKDGFNFNLSANIEFPFESEKVDTYGANGIGLFRTEFLFTEPDIATSEEKQYLIYKQISSNVFPNQLTIRTFDVGRDKTNEYIDQKEEHNPALGSMAIRLFMEKPEILKKQLRAIIRANKNGNIKLLFPMITEIEEILELKKIIQIEKQDLKKNNLLPEKELKIGIMIEIPGTIKLIRFLKDEVDFFSLGTNDLIQYLLAVDRNNSSVSYLYNPFNPSVIASLQEILNEVKKIDKEITVCGEIAGNGLTALMLLGMGFTNFSMNPIAVVEIKRLFTTVNHSFLKKVIDSLSSIKLKSNIEKKLISLISNEYPDILHRL